MNGLGSKDEGVSQRLWGKHLLCEKEGDVVQGNELEVVLRRTLAQ